MALEWGLLDADNQQAVRELILEGLGDHWGTVDPALNPDLDDMLATYADGVTIVATRDGEVVGTGTLKTRAPGVDEIVRMSVARAERRSGLGRQIVDRLTDHAGRRGTTEIVLETTSAWTEVVAFYLSCGFTITHTEVSPFGEDTWFRRSVNA